MLNVSGQVVLITYIENMCCIITDIMFSYNFYIITYMDQKIDVVTIIYIIYVNDDESIFSNASPLVVY